MQIHYFNQAYQPQIHVRVVLMCFSVKKSSLWASFTVAGVFIVKSSNKRKQYKVNKNSLLYQFLLYLGTLFINIKASFLENDKEGSKTPLIGHVLNVKTSP